MFKKFSKPILIAEIGCNHKGDFEIAKKMIETAAKCGADYVKFQKRDNIFLLKEKFNLPHQFQKIPMEIHMENTENI